MSAEIARRDVFGADPDDVYLASGFARDGRTVGKPPRNRARHSDYSHSKTRWVRWLEPTDPAALCAAAGTPPPERGGPR